MEPGPAARAGLAVRMAPAEARAGPAGKAGKAGKAGAAGDERERAETR